MASGGRSVGCSARLMADAPKNRVHLLDRSAQTDRGSRWLYCGQECTEYISPRLKTPVVRSVDNGDGEMPARSNGRKL